MIYDGPKGLNEVLDSSYLITYTYRRHEKMAENTEKAYEAIELAKRTGKIKKGSNEVTKALEKAKAKLVVIAKDITPPEVTMHIPILAKEKGIPCIEVPSKEELGAAAGLGVGTAAVAVTQEGDSKKAIAELSKK